MSPEQRFNENKNLVYYVFHRKFSSNSKNNQYKEDLIQEGMFALWKACLNFDEKRNINFSTYAVLLIYHAMLSFITRKLNKQPCVIPIESVVAEDKDGNELFLLDTLISTDEYSAKDTIDVINKTLDNFPGYYKDLVEKVIAGYNQTEIGNTLGMSQVQISRKLKKFKENLKKHMEDISQ